MGAQKSSLVASGLNEIYLDSFSRYTAAANVEIIATVDDPLQRLAGAEADLYTQRL